MAGGPDEQHILDCRMEGSLVNVYMQSSAKAGTSFCDLL